MAEHDFVPPSYTIADISGNYRGDEYVAHPSPRITSPDNRLRYPAPTTYVSSSYRAIRGGWVPAANRPTHIQKSEQMDISGQHRGKTYQAKVSKVPGMFTERDKIPRIGVHQTLSGYGIPNVDVLITGKMGITTAAKTDERGIWWEYLPVDDYSNADIRSFGGGYVYKMMDQFEREDGYIWDELMKRITPTGAGYRMIYRFV